MRRVTTRNRRPDIPRAGAFRAIFPLDPAPLIGGHHGPPATSWTRSTLDGPGALRAHPTYALEDLEHRQLMAADYRSIDGTGNNLENPIGAPSTFNCSATGSRLTRMVSAPAGVDRPSAREISNAVAAASEDADPNARDLSTLDYVWGQLIDHDLSLTATASPSEALNAVSAAKMSAWSRKRSSY
jgi:hypothetical protein